MKNIQKIRNDYENAVKEYNKDWIGFTAKCMNKSRGEVCFADRKFVEQMFCEREKAIQRLENGGLTMNEIIQRADKILSGEY